jgi:hypothetical protein
MKRHFFSNPIGKAKENKENSKQNKSLLYFLDPQ